jgi:hypothetical protein
LEAGVRAVVQEDTADRDIAFDGSEHEEGPAVLVGKVGVEASRKGGAKCRLVAAFDQILCSAIVH